MFSKYPITDKNMNDPLDEPWRKSKEWDTRVNIYH